MSIFNETESNVMVYARAFPVTFARASGEFIYDTKGKKYLDKVALLLKKSPGPPWQSITAPWKFKFTTAVVEESRVELTKVQRIPGLAWNQL